MSDPLVRSRVELVVVGLGYVGLPLLARAFESGMSTSGFDVSDEVVEGLNAGRSHVADVPDSAVAGMVAAGFQASADPAVLAEAETVVLCVPTGLADGAPDLSAVRTAVRTVGEQLSPNTLVVLESTSYPGTTEEVVRPLLERCSGLIAGEDFHLVYSPERIDPGNEFFGVRNTPKIVGGITPLCAKHGVAFYGRFVDTLVVSRGTREAEMAKLLENTYRYVNIALVNEVALFCDRTDIDVWDVLHCAGTKPFGYSPFQPGPGVGGHCIPVDPVYLETMAAGAGFSFHTLAAARAVNARMPEYVVARAERLLRERGDPVEGSRVLLLGVSYKPDVADTRESPAYPVASRLSRSGADVVYHDPGVRGLQVDGRELPRVDSVEEALHETDIAILLQDHACYDPVRLVASRCLLLDTRGKLAGENVRHL